MNKKYLIPLKSCPKCREKMTHERINKLGDYIRVKYTCSRNNCVNNHRPLIERINIKITKS